MKRVKKGAKMKKVLISFMMVLMMAGVANAVAVSYDEIIFSSEGGTNRDLLSGTVDMSFAGSTLTIILRNTSNPAASTEAASLLFTGIGFNLPTGMAISSGGAYVMAGSTGYYKIGSTSYTLPAGSNISPEWGYDNPPITGGPFLNLTTLSLNTAVTAMESSTTNKFASGEIAPPTVLDGPEFGMSCIGCATGGLNHISDSVRIALTLSGSFAGDLVSWIDSQAIVLSFGSPDTAQVPEPSTLLLLGSGLLGFGIFARRRMK